MHQSFPIVKKTVHSGVHSHNIKHTQAQRRCSLHSYEHVYCLVTAMCACVLGVECVGGGVYSGAQGNGTWGYSGLNGSSGYAAAHRVPV